MKNIRLINLNYRQENEEILQNISHNFIPESISGILSPVEEKASTLLKIIGGILEPTSGTVTIDGIDLFTEDRKALKAVRKKMAFVFERKGILSNLTVQENLLLPLDYHFPELSHQQKLDRIVALLEHFAMSTNILSLRPAKLNSQTLKMTLLIRAFAMEPDIVLYDNPLADLELHYQKAVTSYIQKLSRDNKTTQIFLSTSPTLLKIAHEVLVFLNGTIFEKGLPEQINGSTNPLTKKIINDYLEAGVNET